MIIILYNFSDHLKIYLLPYVAINRIFKIITFKYKMRKSYEIDVYTYALTY